MDGNYIDLPDLIDIKRRGVLFEKGLILPITVIVPCFNIKLPSNGTSTAFSYFK